MSVTSHTSPLVQRASYGQQELWVVQQLYPEIPSANVNVAMHRRGPVDENILRSALVALVERHEALRTTFRAEGDTCFQVIAPHAEGLQLDITDVSGLAAEERTETIERLKLEDGCRPFDLERGPLLRARLVRVRHDEHVLIIIFHHVIIDFASINVIMRDLEMLYQAIAQNRPPDLPPLRIQYVDYTAWEQQLLGAPQTAASLAHLSERLTGTPVLHLMPTRPRPAHNDHHGGQVIEHWEREFVDRLASLGRSCGATFFMTVLTGYAALLSRHSGITDIAIGSPVAGRPSKELEDVVGYFINMLALRVDVSGDPTFSELLTRARQTTLEALANQHVPYELVVDGVRPERAPTEAPLVQVVLNHLTLPSEEINPWMSRWKGGEFTNGTAKYDLFLVVSEGRSGAEVRLQYRNGLLPEQVAGDMLGQLRALLEGALADPEVPVPHLPLVSLERAAIEIARHDGGPAKGVDVPMDELVALQADRTPDAAAVVFGGSKLSYGELEWRANLVAGELLAHSIGRGSVVAIQADGPELGPELVVAALAVLKAGAAYLPLDSEAAASEHAHRLTGADIRAMLADGRRRAPEPAGPVRGRSRPADVAVVFGPRAQGQAGVAVEHRELVACAHGIVERVKVVPGATYACVGPQTTPATIALLYAALLTGGCLCFLPADAAMDTSALVTALRAQPVDYVRLTAWQLASILCDAPDAFSALARRALIVGGAPVPRSLARTVVGRMPEGCDLVALDTCAQATLPCFAASARDELASDAPQLPLGRPLAGCRAYVLDEARRPVPCGVQGELYVGCATVSSSDAWPPAPDTAMWATGERVIALPDGSLELLGRRELQVAVRGFPVELRLIELALTEHPDVLAAAVVPEDKRGERQLLAYVVPGTAGAIESERIRAAVGLRLTPYLVPSAIVVLDRVPLTPHGELARSALPAPNVDAPRQPARTSTEQILAEIWAQVLGRDHVGVTESFFALGGDSVRCMRMCARAAKHGLIVSAIDVFAHPTIAELAPLVLTTGATSARGEDDAGTPLTSSQRRRLDPCHKHAALAALPLTMVEESLARLAGRHEALRLVVRHDHAGWRQELGERLCAVSAHAEADGVRIVGDGALLDEWSWTQLLIELASGERAHPPRESIVAALRRHALAVDEPPLVESGPRWHVHATATIDRGAARSALGVELVDLVVAAFASAWEHGDRLVLEVADLERVVGYVRNADRPLGRLARDVRLTVAAGGPADETTLRMVKEALRALTGDSDSSLVAVPDASVTVLAGLPAAIRDLDEQTGPLVAPLEVRVRADHDGDIDLTLCGTAAAWSQGVLEGLADRTVAALGSIVGACAVLDRRVYTPSDFPEAGLSQDQLDRLLSQWPPSRF